MHGGGGPMQRVRCFPLDDLLDSSWRPGFLKIDVEGFEQEVLSGAQRTIGTHRPVIYLENDRVEKSQALIQTLWGLDYQCWFHMPRLFNPENHAGVAANIYGNLVSFNMLCLPVGIQHCISEQPITDSSWHPIKAQSR